MAGKGADGALWNRVSRLDETINIDGFRCGKSEIDTWFHRDALEQQELGGCTVYVALGEDGVVVGFFSLNMYYLQKRTAPDPIKADVSKLPGNIPCVLLGRLGVDIRYRGEALRAMGCPAQGPLLLKEAISRARKMSEEIGCRLMYVQAKNDKLVS